MFADMCTDLYCMLVYQVECDVTGQIYVPSRRSDGTNVCPVTSHRDVTGQVYVPSHRTIQP